MNPVSLGRITQPALIPQPKPVSEPAGSFSELLSEAVGRVSQVRNEADQQLLQLLAGEAIDLHRVLLAGEKAGLASQLMMSIRNKVVDAYQEVMRMQV